MSQVVTIKVECEDWKDIDDLCDAAYLCAAVYREDCWGRVISIESEKKKE